MKNFTVIILFVACLLGLSVGCTFESTSGDPNADMTNVQQEALELRKDFDVVFADWKDYLNRLREARNEYRVADQSLQPGLAEQYDTLLEEGDLLQKDLIQRAKQVVKADPENNKDLLAFLVFVLTTYIDARDYERAHALAQQLYTDQIEDPRIVVWAGSTAFAINDFDLAKAHLSEAQERFLLNYTGQEKFKALPLYQKSWQRESALREKEDDEDPIALPRVRMMTSQGEVVFELFENEAPNTVANFISLVDEGYYDGLTFHRVIEDIAQGGCPDGTGMGDPGYRILSEFNRPDARRHFRGSLSMANNGPDTGGSQFFVALAPARYLDGKHTVFGRVIRGMDVFSRLTRRDPNLLNRQTLPPADRIISAEVIRLPRDRDVKDYDPKTIPTEEKKKKEKERLDYFKEIEGGKY